MEEKRIEFLYKALDDVTNTIRSLDTKASLIFAIVVFIGGGYITLIKELPIEVWLLIPFLPLFTAIIFFLLSYHPVTEPKEIFKNENSELNKKFYIPTFYHRSKDLKIDFEDLYRSFDENIRTTEEIQKVLLYEVTKLSHIRDTKVGFIKKGIFFIIITLFFMIFGLIFS